jgi:hypothetical protein
MSFENAVVGGGTYEFAIVYAYTLDGTLETYLTIGYADDFLVEYALDALFGDIEL